MHHPLIRLRCNCTSAYQDKKYGSGVRTGTPINRERANGKLTSARCTVCGKNHPIRGA